MARWAAVAACGVALAFGGCGRNVAPAEGAGALATCAPAAERAVSFSTPGGEDRLVLQAVGDACGEAAVLMTLRDPEGRLLWADAEPLAHTTALLAIEGMPHPDPAGAATVWMADIAAGATLETTAAAPGWPEGAPRPEIEGGLYYETSFSRALYEDVRARALPMLCFEGGFNVRRCLYRENGGTVILLLMMSS